MSFTSRQSLRAPMMIKPLKAAMMAVVVAGLLALPASVKAQGSRVVSLAELKKAIASPGEKVRVINFWATWCGPCIKELPLFEKIGKERTDVEVILVSTDLDLDPNPGKVHRFVKKKSISSTVMILEVQKTSDWIDQLEKEWSGALPATLVINTKTGARRFVEKELHEGDLEKLIAEVQ